MNISGNRPRIKLRVTDSIKIQIATYANRFEPISDPGGTQVKYFNSSANRRETRAPSGILNENTAAHASNLNRSRDTLDTNVPVLSSRNGDRNVGDAYVAVPSLHVHRGCTRNKQFEIAVRLTVTFDPWLV
jgi:hypothetical protein